MVTKKKKVTRSKSAAVVTIFDAPNMTKDGRSRIAQWLRDQAKFLLNDGKNFSKRFTARYLYYDGK